ncbi:hypothetical protein FACS189413_16370 [Bacteroidia bacterium]|nr:hypothetical protein FACS189413_16370 [Bacteroidia bacterium]
MNLYHRTYHYIGEITLKDGHTLKLERLSNKGIDPWLFLVFDKKGEKMYYTFFYKIERSTKTSYEKTYTVQMSFIVEEGGLINTREVIKLGQTYDICRGDDVVRGETIGTVKIIDVLIS